MRQYSNYKPSEVEWIGNIPIHWDVKSLKYIVSCNDDSISESIESNKVINYIEIGDVSDNNGVEKYTQYQFKDSPSRARRIVKNGDIIISTVRTYLRAITSITDENDGFIVSTGFAVLRPLNIESSYLKHLALANGFIEEIISKSKGVSYPSITSQELINIKVPIPKSKAEQIAIGRYLDEKTLGIKTLISEKISLIELLKEERSAIINHAVTKGINSKVKLKPSGIEWIGDIPEHWQSIPLKYIGTTQNGISEGAEYFGSGYPFVSYGDVYKSMILPESVDGLANSTDKDRDNFSVSKGDVFFTRTSETIEEIGLASTCLKTIQDAVFAGFLIRFRPFKDLLFEGFSKYYFRSEIHRTFFIKEMNIVTRASLSQGLLKRLLVLLPDLNEQKEISNFLDVKTKDIDNIISKTEKEIELLNEYKTALISEVVTGKVDVREEVLA